MISRFALSALAIPLSTVAANAAPVVDTYKVVSNFTTGTISQVTSIFTLTYDPAVTTGAALVTNYSTSVGSASFNPSVVQFSNTAAVNNSSSVFVGGSNSGPDNVVTGTSDFRIGFFVIPTTGAPTSSNRPLIPFNAITDYSIAGTTSYFSTFDTTVTLISGAVPEASTWAMMMFGVGAIGLGLRRRQSKVTTRIRFA